ncbi:MAG: hypothetical protein JW820_15565 [Spirochaetales bacterium]|nr:hypothetical protein [Spirochaetales bacterium]
MTKPTADGEPGARHHLMTSLKAMAASLPVAATVVSLIEDHVLRARTEACRRTMSVLASRLRVFQHRLDAETVNRDEFSDLFQASMMAATRSSQEEKHLAAANLIANVLLKEGDPAKSSFDELEHCAHALEALSVAAIRILGEIYREWKAGRLGHRAESDPTFAFDTILRLHPDQDFNLLMGLVRELDSAHLLHVKGTGGLITTAHFGNYPMILTGLGMRFVERLLQPNDEG